MVLRGKQFRRSGPSGCAYLTGQVFSSKTTRLLHGRRGMRLICKRQIPSSHRMPWLEKLGAGKVKGSRAMAREGVRYVMAILGNRDWPPGLGGHAPGVHGHPRIQEHQESRNTDTGRWQVG